MNKIISILLLRDLLLAVRDNRYAFVQSFVMHYEYVLESLYLTMETYFYKQCHTI